LRLDHHSRPPVPREHHRSAPLDAERPGAHGHDRDSVIAPMPGKIVRVLVTPGDRVEPGQGIIVVEAMKMQNEMKSRRAGRVASIPVSVGDTVAAGAILATIE